MATAMCRPWVLALVVGLLAAGAAQLVSAHGGNPNLIHGCVNPSSVPRGQIIIYSAPGLPNSDPNAICGTRGFPMDWFAAEGQSPGLAPAKLSTTGAVPFTTGAADSVPTLQAGTPVGSVVSAAAPCDHGRQLISGGGRLNFLNGAPATAAALLVTDRDVNDPDTWVSQAVLLQPLSGEQQVSLSTSALCTP